MSDMNWISIEDAGARLKRTERQIYGYCRDGQLVHKKESGKMLVSVDSVQAFMELHEGTRNMRAADAENQDKTNVNGNGAKNFILSRFKSPI